MAKRKRSLGTIGKVKDRSNGEQLVFDYFGSEFRLNPLLSNLDFVDFLEAASDVDEKDPRNGIIVKSFIRSLIHEADFDEFWRVSKQNGQDFPELMATCEELLTGLTARPTGQPSDSSDGLLNTEPSSTED